MFLGFFSQSLFLSFFQYISNKEAVEHRSFSTKSIEALTDTFHLRVNVEGKGFTFDPTSKA